MGARYSVNFNAQQSLNATSIALGKVVCVDSAGTYVVGTTANRITAGRYAGIARSSTGAAMQGFELQSHGFVPASETGLGAGIAANLSVDSVGSLTRAVGAGYEPVGFADVYGNAYLNFGATNSVRDVTFTPAGHSSPVSMTLALTGASDFIWSLDDNAGRTFERQWDTTYKSWYDTADVSNQMAWWPQTGATYFRAYLPSFPQGIALGRYKHDGAAFTNQYPRMFNATRVPIAGEGTHAVGDTIFNNNPSSGNPIGWMCTVAGNPGTWKSMGNLA